MSHLHRTGSGLLVTTVCFSTFLALTPAANGLGDASKSRTLVAAPASGGTSLVISGANSGFRYQTANQVFEPRLLEVPGTQTAVALWTESNAGDDAAASQEMYAYTVDGVNFSLPQAVDNLIRLRYSTFDPLGGVGQPAVPTILTAPMPEVPQAQGLYLVQFVAPPLEAFDNQVTALGGKVLNSMPTNCRVVQMSSAVRDQVAALPAVRWTGPLHLAYKLDEPIIAEVLADVLAMPAWRYWVKMYERGPTRMQEVGDQLLAMGGTIQGKNVQGYTMLVTMTGPQLMAIAALNEVEFIDVWGPGGVDMDNARLIGGAVPLLSGLGFTGQGVRAEVLDGGVLMTHQAFAGPAPLMHGAANVTDSHGTSTYGINFGNGAANAAGTGMCPNREQGFMCRYQQLIEFGGAVSRYTITQQMMDPAGAYRCVYQSSSIGSPQVFQYNAISHDLDDMLFLYDSLHCQSQSNTGNQNSRPQAWAKNVVSVGGVVHQNTLSRVDDSWGGASFGPAPDGRVKPDLAHFYDNVLTTTTGSDVAYTSGFNGTSAASPITAGHFGLLFQMWHQGVFSGFGGAATVFLSRPHAATAKALMVNSAFKYNWLAGGANANLDRSKQGWGMADLARLYNDRLKTYIINETDLLTPGTNKVYQIQVAAAEPELRVTMVYSDPAGIVGAAQARRNDLSVKVVTPSGITYWGNNGLTAGNSSSSGGVANTVDTVENVFIPSPPAGVYTVTVYGSDINIDSHTETPALDADYALVVAGGVIVQPCPPDISGNGSVEINDLLAVINGWGACPLPCPPYCAADVNHDCAVNVNDLLAVINAWGPCP